MTIMERRERTREWLRVIYADVQDLIIDRHIFWEVQGIVRNNPVIRPMPSHFFHWMMAAHVEATAIGIRRQVKRDNDSISLRRFLEELREHPDIASRDHYIETCRQNPDLPGDSLDRAYDRLVGEGRVHLDPAAVDAELDQFRATAARVEHLADRRFAHYDQRGTNHALPTFDDITASLQCAENLVKRYELLLEGAAVATLLPAFQYDWTAVFRHPWIRSDEDQQT